MFEVICPSMFTEFLDEMLIPSIEKNTILPQRVIIIDNSSKKVPWKYKGDILNVRVAKPVKPKGVNESWWLGFELSGDCEFLSILNDDIILGRYFFEKVKKVFRKYEAAGVVIPETVENIHEMPDPELPESKQMRMMRRRQGWAFTIRKELIQRMPPMPYGTIGRTFCGDDWIHFWTSRQWKRFWAQDVGNVIYHAGGSTLKRIGITDDAHRGAKRAFCELKDEIVYGKERAAQLRLNKRKTDMERGIRKTLVRYHGMTKRQAAMEAKKRVQRMTKEGKI